jgi:hypothetical protein
VLRAAKVGVPVAIVNQGPTRGDEYATVRLDAPLGPALRALLGSLEPPARTSLEPASRSAKTVGSGQRDQ